MLVFNTIARRDEPASSQSPLNGIVTSYRLSPHTAVVATSSPECRVAKRTAFALSLIARGHVKITPNVTVTCASVSHIIYGNKQDEEYPPRLEPRRGFRYKSHCVRPNLWWYNTVPNTRSPSISTTPCIRRLSSAAIYMTRMHHLAAGAVTKGRRGSQKKPF